MMFVLFFNIYYTLSGEVYFLIFHLSLVVGPYFQASFNPSDICPCLAFAMFVGTIMVPSRGACRNRHRNHTVVCESDIYCNFFFLI